MNDELKYYAKGVEFSCKMIRKQITHVKKLYELTDKHETELLKTIKLLEESYDFEVLK